MIRQHLHTRHAVAEDHSQINNLLFLGTHTHRHIDWRAPLDWLGAPHYFVIEDNGNILATLACPQDPPGIAWLRLFTHKAPLTDLEAWSVLWEAARAEIGTSGGATVAVITTQIWISSLLQKSGFNLKQNIVMLTAQGQFPEYSHDHLNIRTMTDADLPAVTEVDWSAFEPLWRNSLESTTFAKSQSTHATVAEFNGQMLGYQISTHNPRGVHLARLAVRKEAQGKGVGSALLGDLFRRLRWQGVDYISVNTQADNYASLQLYQKFGFTRTGEQYPVYTYEVGASS